MLFVAARHRVQAINSKADKEVRWFRKPGKSLSNAGATRSAEFLYAGMRAIVVKLAAIRVPKEPEPPLPPTLLWYEAGESEFKHNA